MSFANVLKQFKKTKRKPKSSAGSSMVDNDNTSQLTNSLDVMGKNSMALPVIMRDINVMKQGILKLVKIAGGTQRDRADRFFLSASDREKSYESQIASTKSTSPTKIGGDKKDGKGFFGKTNDFLNSMISGGLTNLLIKGGIIATILYGIGKFFTSSEFRKSASDMIGNLGKTVFGEEVWKDVKKNIATGAVLLLTGYVAIKASLMYLSAMITKAAFGIGGRRGVPGGPGRMGRMFRGVGFAGAGLGLYNMFSDGDSGESSGLGGVAAAATGLAVGSALNNTLTPKTEPTKPKEQYRDPKTGRYAKAPVTKWSRFLVFLEKKSPLLFKKIGKRLLLAGAGLAVPGPGWIMTAISVLGSISLAWELYGWWKEFNAESDNTSSNSPEKISSSDESAGMTDEDVRRLISQSGGISLSGGANPDYYRNAGMTPSTSTSPLRMSPTSTSPTPSSSTQTSSSVPTLQQIGQAESGKMGYDAANKGKAGDMPNGMPGLSSKKVGEVMQLQSEKRLFAAGKYQIIPATLARLVNSGVVGVDDIFDAKTQDKLGQSLYDKRIAIAGNDAMKQQFELSKEWAAIANPYTGISYYADRGNNKASLGMLQTNNGSQLNQGSRQLSNSQNASSGSPMVINVPPAPTVNGGGGGGQISLPASGVIDNELAKLLVERAVG
jgi:hypothetical protein